MNNIRIAIIGSGPAGLMAAYQVASAGYLVDLYEKSSGIGRKLLIAGSSGLNIANSLTREEFLLQIEQDGNTQDWNEHLKQFFTGEWLNFINQDLKLKTFLGTSKRYFVEEMHSATLVQEWFKLLKNLGVSFYLNHEVCDLQKNNSYYNLSLKNQDQKMINIGPYQAVGCFLGGASWEKIIPTWHQIFEKLGLSFIPFQSANVGFHVAGWNEHLVKEALGAPVKNCILTTKKGSMQGDLIITEYGLEGTPVYSVGVMGLASIDFFPQKSIDSIVNFINKSSLKENKMPFRILTKMPGLNKAVKALLFHLTPEVKNQSAKELALFVKNYPLEFKQSRPLLEAISSTGGISMKTLDSQFMSIDHPGLFLAGEMLNWSAPTGGFLIQTCVTQGYVAAQGIISYLRNS